MNYSRNYISPRTCNLCKLPKTQYFLNSSTCIECAKSKIKGAIPDQRPCVICNKLATEFVMGNSSSVCLKCAQPTTEAFTHGEALTPIEEKPMSTTTEKPTLDQKKQRRQLLNLCKVQRKALGLSSAKISRMMGKSDQWLGSREVGLAIITPQELQLLQDKLATYAKLNPNGAPKKSEVVKPADKKGNGPVIKKPLDEKKTERKRPETKTPQMVAYRQEIKALRESKGLSQTQAAKVYVSYHKPKKFPQSDKQLATWWWRFESESSDKSITDDQHKRIIEALTAHEVIGEKESIKIASLQLNTDPIINTRTMIEQGALHTLPDGRQFKQEPNGSFTKVDRGDPILESDSMLIQIKNGKLVVKNGKSINELEELCDEQRGRIEELEQEIADFKGKLRSLLGGTSK